MENHDFDPSRVDRDEITAYLRENPTKSVNQNDVTEIAEYAGFVTTRQNLYHIPVIGPSGIGKTQLLHTVIGLLSEVDATIDTKLIRSLIGYSLTDPSISGTDFSTTDPHTPPDSGSEPSPASSMLSLDNGDSSLVTPWELYLYLLSTEWIYQYRLVVVNRQLDYE